MADAPYSQNIKQLTRDSYENSAAHGFWDSEETDETVPSKLALIHSEVSEALESYRDPNSDDLVKVPADLFEWLVDQAEHYGAPTGDEDAGKKAAEARALFDKWKAKPKGLDTELADILIRVFDFAGRKGIDLDSALKRKMDYNKGRPKMHGRKV